MAFKEVILTNISREDVLRIKDWLQDDEVAESWFGRYSYGDPAHLYYHPDEMELASDEEWDRVFGDTEHRVLSIYTHAGEHIGEVHIALEESLRDGQLSMLIGRKDLWHHGYDTAGIRVALDFAFNEFGLYRVWVDVPEYNSAARSVFEQIGFVHEGTLRKSRPHEGSRFDSVVMGILAGEYASVEHEISSDPRTV